MLGIKRRMCCILLLLLVGACQSEKGSETVEAPYIKAESKIEAGRYLALVGGCNDCHTHEYLMREGQVPEEDWFTGSPIGWRGPWGTTYASNLRLRVHEMSEDTWVNTLHTRNQLPPMPWFNVKNISDRDARAMYAYIKSLGPKGEHMPKPLPPGKDPQTPYFSLFPQNLPQGGPGGE